MRTKLPPSAGDVVSGTLIHRPGSRWMPTGVVGVVISVMDCRYGTPLRKMSGCTSPRLGTEPRGAEKDSVSAVRFSSRTLSLGGTGATGSGVGEPRLGRKMVLKPWPVNVPVKAASGPKPGATAGLLRACRSEQHTS